MTQKIFIVHQNEYSFPDKESGEIIEGKSVVYLISDDSYPAKVSLKVGTELYNSVQSSGIYNAGYKKVANSKGKLEDKLISLEFVEKFSIEEYLN